MYSKRASHGNMCHRRSEYFEGRGEHPRKGTWKRKFGATFHTAPANVREMDDKFELYLFAPGFEKSDFVIAVLDQTLSISANDRTDEQESWKRHEYMPQGFVRQFKLNESIDKSAIVAKYENGVLIVNLPKSEGFESSRQEIEIT